jgi:type II secretory pathway component PulK
MNRPRNQQGGFILVLTLWVLVIVAIAASYFAERVSRAVELATQSRQNSQALIDMASTRAEILYRLSTTTLTEYGLGRGSMAIHLDNRLYQGEGDTTVRIQDARGLLNLNLVDDARLNRFLGLLGIDAEQRGRLIDTLRDYTDPDNLTRLNGAEEDAYRAINLPPPANQNLVTPWQANRIIGWRDAPQLWENDRLPKLTSTSQSMGINPNTAPAEVLSTLPGVTEDVAAALIAQRQIAPLTHEGQISQWTGAPLNLPIGMGIIAIPSDTMRITQTMSGLPWAAQYTIKLTPRSPRAPWRTDFYSKVGNDGGGDKLAGIASLPPRTITPPDRLPSFLMAQ